MSLLCLFWQCLWGLPQTLVGGLLLLYCRRCHRFRFRGAIVTIWHLPYNVSFGAFVFLSEEGAAVRPLLIHEYGHSLQSLLLGPLYLPLIWLPSMLWLQLPYCRKFRQKRRFSYYRFYTEAWANAWAERVCGERAAQ